ncbi:MAG TPA: hypothetical protein VGR84_19075 [Candidatus Acidoferrales bacterium]|nr:hypothetical protein [Candidatus Acidoferrales bacterium]
MWEAEFCKVCAQEGRKQVAHRSNPPLCRWHFYGEHPELAPEEISPAPWEDQEPAPEPVASNATTAVRSALKDLREREKRGDKMPARKHLDVDALKREYQAGASTVELGEKYGVNSNTIGYHLKKAGVKMRPACRRLGNGAPNQTGGRHRALSTLSASRAPRNGAGGIESEIEALLDSKWNGFGLGEKLRALRAMETMKA